MALDYHLGGWDPQSVALFLARYIGVVVMGGKTRLWGGATCGIRVDKERIQVEQHLH